MKEDLTSDWENIIAYWVESEQSEVLVKKCGSFQKQLGGCGRGSSATPRKFLPSFKAFKLENSAFSS